jgi:signal transduction histidine kinase
MQQLLDAYREAVEVKAAEIAALETAIELDFLTAETPCAISQALEGVDRVAEIVRALKEFSHPSVEAAPVNLNQLIERTALVCRSRWKYVAELTTDFDSELPMVTCMAGEIGQVVLNLLVNGADAIADLAAGNPGGQGMLSVRTKRDGEFVEIRVRDSGTGIPPEARGKIFDPFFTTKPVGSGTGQGLSIAYTIVTRKHRGTIAFETEMGVGTTMIVRLPIAGPEGLMSSGSGPSNCLVEGAIG